MNRNHLLNQTKTKMNSTTPRPIDSICPRRGLWRSFTSLLATGAVLASALTTTAAPATFTPLGKLPGGTFSQSFGVSDDGSTVVGWANSTFSGNDGLEAWRWTLANGMTGLGDFPPNNPLNYEVFSAAAKVSANGSIVVGDGATTNDATVAFRWTQGSGLVSIGDLSGGGVFSQAKSVSADGSVIVGFSESATGNEPFRWTPGGGLVSLGYLPGGADFALAWDVSADGSIVVGSSQNADGRSEAFRWTQATGMIGLGDLPGGQTNSVAYAISPNGQYMVGAADGANGRQASMWTGTNGPVSLGDLPGESVPGRFDGLAYDVSNNGIVVGSSETVVNGDYDFGAFIWDVVHGMRNLQSVLTNDFGLNLDGWALSGAHGITPDGRIIVGTGRGPDGKSQAWLVDLAPVTPLASIIGLPPVPGGSYAVPKDVSDDGSTVVGYTTSTGAGESLEAFRWKRGVGTVGLGDFPPSNLTNSEFTSFAWRTTGDGSAVVGHSSVTNDDSVAFKWTQAGGLLALGDLPGGDVFSQAKGVSDDGSVVVGYSASDLGSEPFRWTLGTGLQPLGTLPGGTNSGIAWDISADGAVIVGQARNSDNITEAFRWTQATGMVGLGDLPGGAFSSRAFAISRNGQWAVGRSVSANGNTAFIWSQATGMIGLGDLPGGAVEGVFDGNAYAVSDSGVAVGSSETVVGENFGSAAFIWDVVHGMRNLKEVLKSDYHVDMTGWTLESAEGISADGRFITGSGSDPDGNVVPWLVELPRHPALPDPLAFTFETFDVPGSLDTLISDINNHGKLVGRFHDAGNLSQGFTQDGTNLFTFNLTDNTSTFPGGQNSLGQIAGFYRNATNAEIQHGFIRQTNGTVTTIDGPGQNFTYVWRVNDAGQANGYWFENEPFFIRSFRRETNGVITPLVYPGSPMGTVARGMNEAGSMTGWKWDENYAVQGAIIVGTNFTEVFTIAGWDNTLPADINNLGDIAGTVNINFELTAGFFRFADGRSVTFAPPGAQSVEVFGLNDLGEVVGEYTDASGRSRGFIARPATKLSTGHTDVGIAFEDGAFDLHIHDEENDVEFAPGGAVLGVTTHAEWAIPDAVAYAFLGEPGRSAWILPQTQNENQLFLGFGAEEINPGVFVGDALRVQLVSVVGGDFALFAEDAFGNPVVSMNSADGISAADALYISAGGHAHYNWAVSEPGTYRIGIRVSGTLVAGNQFIQSEVAYYTFTVPPPVLAQPPEPDNFVYNVVDIGTFGGTQFANALSVNNAGVVVGGANFPDNRTFHPYRYSGLGPKMDLGTGGGDIAGANDLNEAGEITGTTFLVAGADEPYLPFRYTTNGVMQVITNTLGGLNGESAAINEAGRIVGAADIALGQFDTVAFYADADNVMRSLGTFGGNESRAENINDAGYIVGNARLANGERRAFRHLGNGPLNLATDDLGTLGGNRSQAHAINAAGKVTGTARLAGNASSPAFLWEEGVEGTGMTNLGTLGGNLAYGFGINTNDVVVGWSLTKDNDFDSIEAFAWDREHGMRNLNDLVPRGLGLRIDGAYAINEAGWIAGTAKRLGDGSATPVLLQPATRLRRGHADVGLAFEEGKLQFEVHSDDLEQHFTPDTALLLVPARAQGTVPVNPAFGFLGTPGAPVWILPQTGNPHLLFIGLAAAEIPNDTFVNNEVKIALTRLEGPGNFSVYAVNGFGLPDKLFDTSDGITDADVVTLSTGGHNHINWAFTAPGVYRVRLEGSGALAVDNQPAITTAEFYFEVITAQVNLTMAPARGNELTLDFLTEEGVVYQLQQRPRLPDGMWENVGQAFVGTGRTKQLSVSVTDATGYFRVATGN